MIEAIILLKELHTLGVSINYPLAFFVQAETREGKLFMSLIRIKSNTTQVNNILFGNMDKLQRD